MCPGGPPGTDSGRPCNPLFEVRPRCRFEEIDLVFFRLLAICTLAAALQLGLSGCATFPGKTPTAEKSTAVANILSIANLGLDDFEVRAQLFYSDIHPLTTDIKALYARPGWPEMEAIVLTNSVLREPEGKVPELPEMAEWSLRWKRPWEELYSDYLALVDRCSIMEAKRMSLKETLLVLESKYVQAVSMELNSGTYGSAKTIYGVVEALEKYEVDLDSYAIGPIGLYEVIR